MKVVIAEKVSPAALEVLREERDWTVLTHEQVDGKLADEIADADALIVRSAVKVNAALLEAAKKLRVIGRAGIGVDNIDIEAATRKGIAVMNTPGANAVAVAEHTLALALALARHVCRANQLTHAGKWEKKALEGRELRGKTLGVVGLGRIGLEVARRAQAFGMQVLAHDPFVPAAVAQERGVKLVAFEELLASADYVSLHLALTPQTAKIINAETIARMKKGVRLINCARGELIDETVLAEAIRTGQVAGAALDVFAKEPPAGSPLLELEQVIATPHIAGSTREAQEAVGVQIVQQVREYLKRGVIQNAVNVPSVSYEEYEEMQPYIVLAERMGSFLAQTTDGRPEEVALTFHGRIGEWKTELLRNAVLVGILNQSLAEKANLVNAASLAQGRGVQVHESGKPRGSSGGAESVLTAMLKTDRATHLVKGGVLHGRSPRLLAVDDIDVEAPLERNLLYMRNRDVPGVIGRIGTILGEHRINIANFSLGRAEAAARAAGAGAESGQDTTARAIAVIHVDQSVPEEVLNELRKSPAVTEARALRIE